MAPAARRFAPSLHFFDLLVAPNRVWPNNCFS
jgi:hypothetical protein